MKIICVGRNYTDHIRELENNKPKEPVLFLKPDSSIILNSKPFFIPDFSQNIHYELELIIKISRLGKHIRQGRPRSLARSTRQNEHPAQIPQRHQRNIQKTYL